MRVQPATWLVRNPVRCGGNRSEGLPAGSYLGLGTHAATFKIAFHRGFPDLVNHSWTPKPLRLVALVPAGYPDAAELAAFPQAIVHSKWLRAFARAYRIPAKPAALGYGFAVKDMPALPHRDAKTNDVFAQWLLRQLKRHHIRSDQRYQTIVILFAACETPQSLDGFDCASHHPGARIAGFSASTDARSRWNEPYAPRGSAAVVTYSYVRIFSRQANHHSLDPGVPASPHPYYNTATRGDWYLVNDGLKRSVTVTGWSTKPIPKWSVTAKLASWSGSRLGGDMSAPRPCRLPHKTWKVTNGGDFQLEVAPTAAARAELLSQPWCVVALTSAPVVPSTTGDLSHHWFVGFIVIPA